jgi:hypothetical protein
VVVVQDMWWWLRRICVGGCAGYVVVVAQDMWWGKSRIKLTQPLELELGLSLAKMQGNVRECKEITN